MKHNKYNYIKKVVESGLQVLLTGEAGTGKTTIAKQLATDLGVPFSSLSMTKQTSVNAIIGFISINGEYIPSQFRQAVDEGHLFLLDELDAADPNVLLILNTLENGYIAFPDGIREVHPDFRLIATSNPQGAHQIYTGRSKLDFSTIDRYFTIELERDPELELSLTSSNTITKIEFSRKLLKDHGSSIQVTMRDSIRVHHLLTHNLDTDAIFSVIFTKDATLGRLYRDKEAELEAAEKERIAQAEKEAAEAKKTQHTVDNLDELWDKIQEGK